MGKNKLRQNPYKMKMLFVQQTLENFAFLWIHWIWRYFTWWSISWFEDHSRLTLLTGDPLPNFGRGSINGFFWSLMSWQRPSISPSSHGWISEMHFMANFEGYSKLQLVDNHRVCPPTDVWDAVLGSTSSIHDCNSMMFSFTAREWEANLLCFYERCWWYNSRLKQNKTTTIMASLRNHFSQFLLPLHYNIAPFLQYYLFLSL